MPKHNDSYAINTVESCAKDNFNNFLFLPTVDY